MMRDIRNMRPPWLLLMLLAFSFAIIFGYYKTATAQEQVAAEFIILSPGAGQGDEVVVDLAAQGLPKQWLQPQEIQIARYVLKNQSNQTVSLQVKAAGFRQEAVIEAGTPTWQKPGSEKEAVLDPGKSLRLKIRLSLPAKVGGKQLLGRLEIHNQETGNLLGSTPVYALSSAAAPQDEETCEGGGAHHGEHGKKGE